ncbi:MAG: hypothetical protein WA793_00385 [Sphingorhabdus sp.]|uniref:hypothetical protein n=1 Tax=Sphingorhabdus sp. TaxID=1902408 RepID=UPI003C9A1D9C
MIFDVRAACRSQQTHANRCQRLQHSIVQIATGNVMRIGDKMAFSLGNAIEQGKQLVQSFANDPCLVELDRVDR